MLSHCYAPASFCMSTIVNIHKDSGIMGNANVMLDASKVFDCVNVLTLFTMLLKRSSCGFKCIHIASRRERESTI